MPPGGDSALPNAKQLTDVRIRRAKPKEKTYRLFDAGGLYLEVTPSGGRYWRLKYRYGGKEKRLAFGVYPDVTLAEARERRDDARRLLRDSIDPSTARKDERRQARVRSGNTFEAVAGDWMAAARGKWTERYARRTASNLEADVFPSLGARPIAEITAADVLECVRCVEVRDALDVAARTVQRCSAIFRHGILTGRCKSNPAAELRGALKTRKVQHRAALPQAEIPTFQRKLKEYDGQPETRIALQLLMLTFVRTSELRGARWDEIDFDRAEWRIPAERMKMRDEHVVPLATQAIEALRELQRLTGSRELLFPSVSNPRRPMSENTMLYALYRMGYHSRATGHGFRALASTCLNEMGFKPDVIERQLAHAERNKVRAAYNRAQYLDERRGMMQAWADWIEAKAANAPVVTLRRRTASARK